MTSSKLPQLVAVIGAGQMGSGIAQVLAMSSAISQVRLIDSQPHQLTKAMESIKKSLSILSTKGKLNEDPATILQRLDTTSDIRQLSDVDFLIEAVPEREEIKASIFKTADNLLPPHAILASNTSSISITRLGSFTSRPANVIGMHFMNPVPIMTLVELIRGMTTSDETFNITQRLATAMGKYTVLSQDRPGFIVNRILMPMINEAFFALMEGVATPLDIDAGMKLGTNVPMGPLTLADYIGLDTCVSILRVLHEQLGEDKYRPCPLMVQYCDAGWLGKKAGRGVYTYTD